MTFDKTLSRCSRSVKIETYIREKLFDDLFTREVHNGKVALNINPYLTRARKVLKTLNRYRMSYSYCRQASRITDQIDSVLHIIGYISDKALQD